MSSEEENKQQGDGNGFAGLSSMLSDVDDTVASTPNQTPGEASTASTQQSSQASPPVEQEKPRPTPQSFQADAQPSGGSSAGMWLFGVAAVFVIVWLANQSHNNNLSKPAYSPGNSSTSVTPVPASQPPAAQPQAPSRPTEEKPSVGRNNVLSAAQIRYCLAEKIRLDAAESVINTYVDADVNRFNGYVGDYNSRCGEFRYRQGVLESARRDVEPWRSQLQAEGRSRFVRSQTAATKSPTPAQVPQPGRASPDATVQAVQRRLNELGYGSGLADGLMGETTRVAILSFQRDHGLPEDGSVTPYLLERLRSAQGQRQSKSVSSSNKVPISLNPSANSGIPANAEADLYGNGWACKRGYYKSGNQCLAVQIPQHASLNYLGSGWQCNRGYYQSGNQCLPVKIPQNASLNYLGTGWECNLGYRRVGDKCEAI
ncbi:His-Xaa-Ser repeat protein HxsA [compost metagenome]